MTQPSESLVGLATKPQVGPMFDGTYDPTNDPTVSNWNGQGPGGATTAYDLAENKVTHGIDETGDVAAFASVRAPAWHNLGVTFDHQVTAEELLVAAHADYKVIKVPDVTPHLVPMLDAHGQTLTIGGETMMTEVKITDPRKNKLIRQHPVSGEWQALGTCGPDYQVVDNREAFLGFGDALIDVAEPNAATCGVLFGGRQAFMCWKLPKGILVGGVDASELWMLVRTSHDLSTPLTGAITLLRTVCQNTANWNLARAVSKFSIRHTKNAKLNLSDAREALKLSYAYGGEWERIGNELVKTPMMPKVFERIITENFGPGEEPSAKAATLWDEKRDKLMGLFAQADTQANVRNTAWAGLQSVIEYCDWQTKVQAKGTDLTEDGYRFWRSLDAEKSVTNPKKAALRIFADYAGVKVDAVKSAA